jgi:hypothetical protein
VVNAAEHDAPSQGTQTCEVFRDLTSELAHTSWGFDNGRLLANANAFGCNRHLLAESRIGWRSGVKHDCAKVFELERKGGAFFNGFGEQVELENSLVYPLLKGSQVAKGEPLSNRYVIVPQTHIAEDTLKLQKEAPKTWTYLSKHGARLDARKSSIYKKRPRFSVFGIGDYSFSMWKVAISGLHKKLRFTLVSPRDEKPVMLDDTVYFLPCSNEGEAQSNAQKLNSKAATEFFSAFLFWDSKRPITVKILNSLDLNKL